MCRLDVFRMVVSKGPAHPLWISMIGDDVMIVGELFVADSARPVLFSNFSVQQLPHLSRAIEVPGSLLDDEGPPRARGQAEPCVACGGLRVHSRKWSGGSDIVHSDGVS